jgi:hypothetical protein
VRWTVISLVLLNVMFLLWNWLEYSHSKGVEAMNTGAAVGQTEMPGTRIVLLRERAVQADDKGAGVNDGGSAVALVGVASSSTGGVQVGGGAGAQVEPSQCLLLGPYPEPRAAKVLLERLAALQIQGKYAAIEVAGEPDYWVYLRPEPTKELAAAKLRELQEKKVDSFIVPQGDIANGISLGVFDKQENAEKRQQAIIELGYDAQLRINPRNYLENWVVIYPDESVHFSPELYGQLRIDNDKLDLRKDPCNKVASLIDIH